MFPGHCRNAYWSQSISYIVFQQLLKSQFLVSDVNHTVINTRTTEEEDLSTCSETCVVMKQWVYGEVWCFLILINTYAEKHDSEIIPLLENECIVLNYKMCVCTVHKLSTDLLTKAYKIIAFRKWKSGRPIVHKYELDKADNCLLIQGTVYCKG